MILVCNGGGVMALAITPRDELGDLRFLQGFKSRFETVLWLEPVPIAELISMSTGGGPLILILGSTTPIQQTNNKDHEND